MLLEEDPFVASFTEFRRHMDNAHLLTKRVVSSDNPIKPLGRLMDTSRMGVKTEEGRRVRTWIDKGRVMMSHRGGGRQGAHPAHVVEDCEFSVRSAFLAGRIDGFFWLREITLLPSPFLSSSA